MSHKHIQNKHKPGHSPSVNGLPNTRTSHSSMFTGVFDRWIRTTDPMGPWSQAAEVRVSTALTVHHFLLLEVATDTDTVSGRLPDTAPGTLDSAKRSGVFGYVWTFSSNSQLFFTCRILMYGCCHVSPCLNEFSGIVLSCFTLSR